MGKEQILTLLVAAIPAFLSYLGGRYTGKSSLEKANYENAMGLYDIYKQENRKLTARVKELEGEIIKLQEVIEILRGGDK